MSLTRLDEIIKEAGIPIFGLRGVQGDVKIDFNPSATVQQRTDAAAIVASFDWTPRRKRAYLNLINDIAALSAADRNKLLAAVAADFLRRFPRFAQRLSINVDGDEPDV